MIQIKKNPKPDLPIAKMNCDKLLHPKLDKYEMPKTMFQKHATTCIIGKPSQGKSSLVYSFFKSKNLLKKCFTKIFYICPANSMQSLDDNIFGKLPEDQIFNELDGGVLQSIIDQSMGRDDDDKIAIVIDDMASELKKGDVQKLLKQIAMNKRHLGIYETFILSQTFFSIPKEVRRLIDNYFIFKVSQDEMENIMSEVLPQYKDISHQLQKIIYDKKYNYLAIHTQSGRLFKNFDEVIINED